AQSNRRGRSAGISRGKLLRAGATDQRVAEAYPTRRASDLRLHAGGTEGDGAGRIGGVADEREAARHAAGGRWGELYAQGAGLPRRKREEGCQPVKAEAGSSYCGRWNDQVGGAGLA